MPRPYCSSIEYKLQHLPERFSGGHVGPVHIGAHCFDVAQARIEIEGHIKIDELLEPVKHATYQRRNLPLNHRRLGDRRIDVADAALLISNLPLKPRVVDLEAIHLLHHGFVVRSEA